MLPLNAMSTRLHACTACHGEKGEGNDTWIPRLAGQPADYLYQELRDFRDGRRPYGPMRYLTTWLSDAYLYEMATWFAQFPPSPPLKGAPGSLASADITPAQTLVDKAAQARGERLARAGDPDRKLPACVQCHGARLTGQLPATPGIVGLPAAYLSKQMGALSGLRNGDRPAHLPARSHQTLSALSEHDIRDLSLWLSLQPLDAGMRPDAVTVPAQLQ